MTEKLENTYSVREFIEANPTQSDYEKYIDYLLPMLQKLYKNFEFKLGLPHEDVTGYIFAFSVFRPEYPEDFEEMFKLAFLNRLDEEEINQEFIKRVENNELFDLGDDIQVRASNTGISSILQAGDEIRVVLEVVPKELAEEQDRLQKEKQDKKEAEEQERQERYDQELKQREEMYKALTKATEVLNEAVDKEVETNPELADALQRGTDLYRKVMGG